VAAGEQAPDLSGTVTVPATSMAAGIGWSWGSGTLTLLDGSQHQFKVSGLDVVAVGIKQATGVGDVYHLKNMADFKGKYVKAAAGILTTAMLGLELRYPEVTEAQHQALEQARQQLEHE
jgi:hypothetical protein